IDALLLGQALDLAQLGDVTGAVAPPSPAGAAWRHQAETVVLAQRLGVHPGQLGGDRDDERGGTVVDAVRSAHPGCSFLSVLWLSRGGGRFCSPLSQRAAACASPARGSSSPSASRRSSTACLALPSTCVGTATWMVTSRSPVVFLVARPLPRTRRVRPEGVPPGPSTPTAPPPSAGPARVGPSPARPKETAASRRRFAPSPLPPGGSSASRGSSRPPAAPPPCPGRPSPRRR